MMFRFELYKRWKTILLIPILLGFFTYVSMGKFQGLRGDSENTKLLLNQFPKAIQIVFGMNELDITQLSGYVGTIYLYIVLVLVIYCAFLGVSLSAGDSIEKRVDFIYTLPCSRARLLTKKVCAGLIILICLNIFSGFAMLFVVLLFRNSETLDFIVHFQIGLLTMQFLFYAIGVFLGVMIRKRIASTLATSSVLFFYFVALVFQFLEQEAYYIISPFSSLTAVILLKMIPWITILLYVTISILLFVMSYYYIQKSDL